MTDVPEKYRLRAFVCEELRHEATDPTIKFAWAEIAIEWQTLANRAAQGQTDIEEKTFIPDELRTA